MNFTDIETKAKYYLNHNLVKVISAEKGNLIFSVNGHEVYRVKGQWSCNAVNKEEKKGCALFGKEGHECSHIKACIYWLEEFKKVLK